MQAINAKRANKVSKKESKKVTVEGGIGTNRRVDVDFQAEQQ